MALPLASFTVNDGASTPVAQTFSIASRQGTVSEYRNSASALVAGEQVFRHEVRRGTSGAAANRSLITLSAPVEGTVNSQTVVLRSSLFKVEANFAPGADDAERATVWGLFLNCLAQADIKASVPGLQVIG